MNKPSHIPSGYVQNAAGHLVPEDQVREHDKLRDSTATALAQEAIDLNSRLADFKKRALADIADLVSISADKYEVHLGGRKGNVTVTSFDGRYKVVRSYAERVAFTEEIEAAKAAIDACIDRWSEGADANIKVLVDRAFRTDQKGHLKTAAILELLRIDIEDPEWLRAMDALRDSIQITGTAVYIRVYVRRDESDTYDPVPLDLAAV